MTDAMTAATWMIWNNDAKRRMYESDEYGLYEGISHLKLQKLLYYAQGIHLAVTGEKLFAERIMAWKHGPVVEEVYQELKGYGKDPIQIEQNDALSASIRALTDEQEISLNMAYDNFAIYTAWQLRNMTHQDKSPWSITVEEKGINHEINPELIRKYFLANVIELGNG